MAPSRLPGSIILRACLFEFGDRDGIAEAVRLQHPLGVHAFNGLLYVADTYNHKVKVISPGTRASSTLFGRFYEPGGLWVAAGRLWVADTNNHAIRVADLATKEVLTLTLAGL
ncbi:MAG: hypothetical protein HYU24_15410 [Candidatus Rokubacteria bacterium]|nr:hypothetical protein [Candidatus Rokubacteria bacterium]